MPKNSILGRAGVPPPDIRPPTQDSYSGPVARRGSPHTWGPSLATYSGMQAMDLSVLAGQTGTVPYTPHDSADMHPLIYPHSGQHSLSRRYNPRRLGPKNLHLDYSHIPQG